MFSMHPRGSSQLSFLLDYGKMFGFVRVMFDNGYFLNCNVSVFNRYGDYMGGGSHPDSIVGACEIAFKSMIYNRETRPCVSRCTPEDDDICEQMLFDVRLMELDKHIFKNEHGESFFCMEP